MATGFWGRIRRYYLAGLLVLAPTVLTLWVAWKFFTFFDDILGSELRRRGISVFGLGFVLLNLVVLGLGWLTTNFLGKRLFLIWDRVMHRVPLINKIYSTLRQIAEIFLGSSEDASFRKVALVEYGSPGTHMIGFVTSTADSEAGEKLGAKVCHVFVPSAVNPTTGFLLVVPEEKVRYLDMTPEQAMRMIVSAGSIVPAAPESRRVSLGPEKNRDPSLRSG